jgi:SAM-dependent methyltransferase
MSVQLPQLLPAFRQFQLVYVALRIGIPSALAAGPRTLPELASELEVPECRILRLMRGLVWAEIVSFEQIHGFRLTTEGRNLLDDSPTSLAGGILFHGRFFYSAWGHLDEYMRDARIPFEQAHGRRLFDLLSNDPESAREFNGAMSERTKEYSRGVADLPVFHGRKRIVDVGGGEGQLLLDILKIRSESTGVISDLPMLRPEAERAIAAAGLTDRCSFQEGDMFSVVPEAGDLYLLKWVLHDWNDERAGRILQTIRSRMNKESSLLIFERIMTDGITESVPLVQADLNMLVLNGGAERTQAQFSELLRSSGFCLKSVTPIESNYGFHMLSAGTA